MRSIVGEGLSIVSVGAAAGLASAIALTRLMRGILYGVSPTDAWTFTAVTALLVGVALAASLVPARRATRIDPLIALRSE
jgi:putative ABC transport system permease protein